MWGRSVRWAILIIVAAMLCGHVTELFDHWDHTLRTGREADYTLVVLAACAGLEIVLARTLIVFFTGLRAPGNTAAEPSSPTFPIIWAETLVTGPSPPPLPLSLRI
jgi:hypothetical protein